MTQERFSRIVDDPELLRTITYEELKTLALAYPYANNLWYFLAIKARQIDHPDVAKNVATAAAYSLDRTQLFKLVAPQMIAPQEVWIAEEMLELKPIETLKRKLEEELSVVAREDAQETAPLAAAAQEIPTTPMGEGHFQEIAPVEAPKITTPPVIKTTYLSYEDWYQSFQPPLLTRDQRPTPPPASSIVPQPVEAAQKTENQTIEPKEEMPDDSEAPIKSGSIAQQLAEKSVSENKDVISETLAKLFAKQGYRDKAIAMYERLMLAIPEKSAYFAAEIEKLKK